MFALRDEFTFLSGQEDEREWKQCLKRHWSITTSSREKSKHRTINTYKLICGQTVPRVLSNVGLDTVPVTPGEVRQDTEGLWDHSSGTMWHYSQQDLIDSGLGGGKASRHKL